MESQWEQSMVKWGQDGWGPSRSRREQSLRMVTATVTDGSFRIPCPIPCVCLRAYLGGGSAKRLWHVCVHMCVMCPFVSLFGCGTYVRILHNGMFSKTTE